MTGIQRASLCVPRLATDKRDLHAGPAERDAASWSTSTVPHGPAELRTSIRRLPRGRPWRESGRTMEAPPGKGESATGDRLEGGYIPAKLVHGERCSCSLRTGGGLGSRPGRTGGVARPVPQQRAHRDHGYLRRSGDGPPTGTAQRMAQDRHLFSDISLQHRDARADTRQQAMTVRAGTGHGPQVSLDGAGGFSAPAERDRQLRIRARPMTRPGTAVGGG